VESLDNSKIQIAFAQIIAALNSRHLGFSEASAYSAVSLLHLRDSRCLKQIQTFARIDDGPNHTDLARICRLIAGECF
jgi:hypothetical protein